MGGQAPGRGNGSEVRDVETTSPALNTTALPERFFVGDDRFILRLLPERMDDKAEDSDADAGVGHIECGPGMSQRDMQIEEQEIDDMTVQQPVRQISEDPSEKERERNVAPSVVAASS